MRSLSFLLYALTFGCDDPAVSAKALDVLEHGIVEARIACAVEVPADAQCWSGPRPARYTATKLADGACLAFASVSTGSVELRARSEAGDCQVTIEENLSSLGSGVGVIDFSAAGGNVSLSYRDTDASLTPVGGCSFSNPEPLGAFAVDTYCTGFNLEAFD